jgi:hypothetical protein
MMNIGKPQRIVRVEPLRTPVPEKQRPEKAPAPKAPAR